MFVTSFGQKKIYGTWIFQGDKKYSIILKDSTWTDIYDNENAGTGKFFLQNNSLITITNEGDTLKYDIMNLTKNILSLVYLGNGKILLFHRK